MAFIITYVMKPDENKVRKFIPGQPSVRKAMSMENGWEGLTGQLRLYLHDSVKVINH